MTDKNKPLTRILSAISKRNPIHYQIPNVGKFIFNKIVPYIFIYRVPETNKRDKMLVDLAKTENASIVCKSSDFPLDEWIHPIAQKLAKEFGACLLVEAWIAQDDQQKDIKIHIAQKDLLPLAEYFEKNINLEGPEIKIELSKDLEIPQSPELAPLFSKKELQNKQILLLGLSIKQNYLDNENILPILIRVYRETLAKSLSRLFFEFLRVYTHLNATAQNIVFQQELTPLMVDIDQALAQESKKFDFLLMVTPLNAHEAWIQFKKDKYWKTPKFLYRPLHIDPDLVKRRLYNLRIEDIYDPTMAYIFRDKRTELDSMVTMIADRGKEDFVHGSLQVFGNVSEKLYNTALSILMMTDPELNFKKKPEEMVNAHEFAKLAREEIRFLQKQNPEFNTSVRVREDISGVMVNRGALNISQEYKLTKSRAKALIQHEIGTHVVTYFNGRKQPLNLFSLGVPGYEELQEGLAVLSEFIIGGLNNQRLRIIAARVIVVHHMLLGSSFRDTFGLLIDQYSFAPETAFQISMRVYRGGGLTKDALYLKGIMELLTYLKEGNNVHLLMMGKIRKDYLPIIKDLLQKEILIPPAITPRYLFPEYSEKWSEVKTKGSIFKLIN